MPGSREELRMKTKQYMGFRYKFIKHDLWLLVILVIGFSCSLLAYFTKDYFVILIFMFLMIIGLVGKLGQVRYYYQFDGWKKG